MNTTVSVVNPNMAAITINGNDFELDDNEQLNVIEAAERFGIEIPYYCWHPGLSVVASCRMCLVEIGQKNDEGVVRMVPRLMPACQTPARDQTVVVTNSDKVVENRKAVEEYLLLDHPVDCPICDRAGECSLQDYYYEHGRDERRDLPQPFTSRRKDLGPEVTFFADRCVMCSRCVRFTREVSGTAELQVVDRGNKSEIDIFPGHPIDNKLSGNVVDLCPVGALCSRDFLYKQRVWFLNGHDSVCPGCATGCNIRIDEHRNTIYRLKPRHNPNVNDWWICDEGRLGYQYVASSNRLTTPRQRTNGNLCDSEWSNVMQALKHDLNQMIARYGGQALACILSPMLTCEEAYLLTKYVKSLAQDVTLALGKVPVVGEDDVYPKTADSVDAPKFIIRAEKCPNRRGVEAIIRHWDPEVLDFATVHSQIVSGAFRAVILTGGYPQPWLHSEEIAMFSKLDLVILVDILKSEATGKVDYLLPGAAWAEKPGSYLNHAELLQITKRAVRPPGDAHTEGRIFWELAGRQRLYNAGDVLDELAEEVPFFAPCGNGKVGARGVMLGTERNAVSGKNQVLDPRC